jgi:hypothetical protein
MGKYLDQLRNEKKDKCTYATYPILPILSGQPIKSVNQLTCIQKNNASPQPKVRLKKTEYAQATEPILPTLSSTQPLKSEKSVNHLKHSQKNNALPLATPKRSTTYRITIDGKTMTAIDTTGATYEQFIRRINIRFGSDRVGKIEISFT